VTVPAPEVAAATLRAVRARPVLVPLRRPIIAGIGRFDRWPLVLIDVEISDGVVGSAYLAPYRANVMPAIVAEAAGRELLRSP
jgi:mandelate racemase